MLRKIIFYFSVSLLPQSTSTRCYFTKVSFPVTTPRTSQSSFIALTYLLTYLTITEAQQTNGVSPSEAVDSEDGHHLHSADVRLESTSAETWTWVHFKVHQRWAAHRPMPCHYKKTFYAVHRTAELGQKLTGPRAW